MKPVTANSHVELVSLLKKIEVNVGGRIGADRRTNNECELYVLKGIIENISEDLNFPWPITLRQSDAPDFLIKSDNGDIGIEITEATPPEDSREMAIGELKNETYSFGQYGGQKSGGPKQDIRLVIAEIQKSISRKSKKPYIVERPTELWIYPNSNAAWWLIARRYDEKGNEERNWAGIREVSSHTYSDTEGFRRIIVYYSDNIIEIIKS